MLDFYKMLGRRLWEPMLFATFGMVCIGFAPHIALKLGGTTFIVGALVIAFCNGYTGHAKDVKTYTGD